MSPPGLERTVERLLPTEPLLVGDDALLTVYERVAYAEMVAGALPHGEDLTPAGLRHWLNDQDASQVGGAAMPELQSADGIRKVIERTTRTISQLYRSRSLPTVRTPIWLESDHNARWRHFQVAMRGMQALLALEFGEVLSGFARSNRQTVVWQIGGDGGDLASRIALTQPRLLYVTMDHPEHLLAAAVRLMVSLPDAQLRWAGARGVGTTGTDLMCVPLGAHATADLRPPDLLVIPGGCADRMPAEVESLVARARAMGCPFLCTPAKVNSKASHLTIARMAADYFWMHHFSFLTEKLDTYVKQTAEKAGIDASIMSQPHLVGWRRIAI